MLLVTMVQGHWNLGADGTPASDCYILVRMIACRRALPDNERRPQLLILLLLMMMMMMISTNQSCCCSMLLR